MAQFFGVYRGVVLNAVDPGAAGRVQVRVPSVFGAENAWAPVCTAFGAGTTSAATIGSDVCVAFEAGDPARPVVLGALRSR